MSGPACGGSPDVLVNAFPALRVGDAGLHGACCGGNTWTAAAGSATVFINGKAAHRRGDRVEHCGGEGRLVVGSADVVVGPDAPPVAAAPFAGVSIAPGGTSAIPSGAPDPVAASEGQAPWLVGLEIVGVVGLAVLAAPLFLFGGAVLGGGAGGLVGGAATLETGPGAVGGAAAGALGGTALGTIGGIAAEAVIVAIAIGGLLSTLRPGKRPQLQSDHDDDGEESQRPGRISGRASDDRGGSVSGVTIVAVPGGTTTTRGDGRYTIEGVPPGSATVTASKAGYLEPASVVVTVPPGGTATADFTLQVPRLELYDRTSGATLGSNTSRIVGERVSLGVRVVPSGTPATALAWTLPGELVGGAVQTPALGSVTPEVPRDGVAVDFHWTAATRGAVSCAATVAGQRLTASCTFDVAAPTRVSFSATSSAMGVGDYLGRDAIGLFVPGAAFGAHVGIRWSARCTGPSGSAGELALIQTLQADRRRTIGGAREKMTTGAVWMLDSGVGSILYGAGYAAVPIAVGAGQSADLGDDLSDSPNITLAADMTIASLNDRFVTWLVYRPTRPGAIWVTLASLAWRVVGMTERPTTADAFGPLTGANPTAAATITGIATSTLPTWSGDVRAINRWVPE